MSISSWAKYLTQFHWRENKNSTWHESSSFEGILYHQAFSVIHRTWDSTPSWKFLELVIASRWPTWLSPIQKGILLEEVQRVYNLLKNQHGNDKILRTEFSVSVEGCNGRIDAVVARRPDLILVREIKRSISFEGLIPDYHKVQLALYAYALEQTLEQPPPKILNGEIVSIIPPGIHPIPLKSIRQDLNIL